MAPRFEPEQILAVLTRHGVRFVLIGGVAASLHGSEQVTRDIDIVHENTASNLDRLVAALTELGALRISIPGERTEPRADDFVLRIEQFVCPIGNIDVIVDARSIGGYNDIIGQSESIELTVGLQIQIADIDQIILSKAGSGRDKDPNHIRSLERIKELRAEQRLNRPGPDLVG